jgi:peptidoglycan/xylan/chitin deacetylase (PgdA/CDA1 family)
VFSVLAAVALTRMNALSPPSTVAANAPASKPAAAPKPVPPADPVSTVASIAPVSTAAAAVTSAPAAPESTPATPPGTTIAAGPATPAPPAAPAPAAAPTPPAPTAPAAPPAPAPQPVSCPGNPDALGIARTVQIDTTGGPGFGFEHFKQHDFLKPGEVVLTFDDGPWPNHTPAVLAALAHHCTKALFFPIGKHATYYPEILRQVAAAAHTIGSHTWSHADLSKKSPDEAKAEIEKGISAVAWALEGAPVSPFFRFPALKHPPEMVTYLGERNIGIFSTDLDSFDFKMRKPDQVIKSVMDKLKKNGKGIVLMHDFQRPTAEAIATLLDQLKANGYKIVFVTAKDTLKTLPEYDEQLREDQKLPTVSQRPTSDVVHEIQ